MTSSEEVKVSVQTHSMLSGVPVREHGRSIRPPLSAQTHTTFSPPHIDHMISLNQEGQTLTSSNLDLAAGLQLDPGDLFTSSSNNWRRTREMSGSDQQRESRGVCWFNSILIRTSLDWALRIQVL